MKSMLMLIKRLSVVAILFVLACLATQHARAEALDDGRLTLDEAWSLARSHSPDQAAANERVAAAAERGKAATGDLLPRITASGRYTRLSEVDPTVFEIPGLGELPLSESIVDTYALALDVTQPLFTGFALVNAREIARLTLKAKREQARQVRADLRVSLEQAYLGEVAAAAMLEAVDDAIETVEAHRQLVRRMEEVGLATRLELNQADTRLAELNVTRVEVESRKMLARLALHFLTGIPVGTAFEIDHELEADLNALPQRTPQQLVQEAFEARPELRALGYAAEIAASAAEIEKGQLLPAVALNFNYQYNRPNERIFPLEDEFEDTWAATINLSWKLFDGLASVHRAAAARRERAAARHDLDQAKDMVMLDVAEKLLDLQTAIASLNAVQAAHDAATEGLRVARERYEVGDATSTEVLDAQSSLTEAEFRRIEARATVKLARSRLNRSLGRDPT